jgi:hypothetical protein
MVKITENENLNGDEKPKSGLDILLDNLVFAEMCKAARETEEDRKSLTDFIRMKCKAFDNGLLEILDNIRTDFLRKLDPIAADNLAFKKTMERIGVGTAASALASASCFARQLLYDASADEQVEEAKVFDKWLADHGIDVPRRVIDMGTGREEGKDA